MIGHTAGHPMLPISVYNIISILKEIRSNYLNEKYIPTTGEFVDLIDSFKKKTPLFNSIIFLNEIRK